MQPRKRWKKKKQKKKTRLLKCTQDDRGIFNQARAITRYEPACLVGSLDASVFPNARSFSADSY